MERMAVDHLAAPQREDLDDGTVPLGSEADHVDRPDGLPLDGLPLDEVLDGEEAVPAAGRGLETVVPRPPLHPPLQPALDPPLLPPAAHAHPAADAPAA